MNSFGLNQGAVFDIRSLDSLKVAVKNDSAQGAEVAAKQLEGLFVQMMLKSMRDASFKGGIFDSPQSNMFTSMYDQQISQEIANSGKLGFSDLIMSQLTGKMAVTARNIELVSNVQVNRQPESKYTKELNEDLIPVKRSNSSSSSNQQGFISRMMAPAIAAAKQSGIHHQLILAQAALESGWGGREILTSDGKPSHNIFSIKATSGWKGETTETITTEYVNGVPQKIKANFKVYPSYTAALADYTSLLNNNPRYKNVSRSSSPELAAKALQSGGYATDPAYANKLINIIQNIQKNVGEAAKAYGDDISSLF